MMAVTFAVLTGPGYIGDLRFRKWEAIGYLVNPHPEILGQSIVRVLFSEGYVVFCHTGHHASPTTCAFVQIDNHTEFVLRSVSVTFLVFLSFVVMCLFHGFPFLDD